MTSVPVRNVRGEVVGSVDLDERVFGIEPNRAVLHQAVVMQLANKRKGTHQTKTRAEVAGGTHKMYRQKGTGRARQGDRRAPHWTGGGVVFGPHPRSYRQAMPRKMRRLAMRSALSARLAEAALSVVDELAVAAPRTREMVGLLRALGLSSGALIVVPERDEALARASANLEGVRTVTPGGLCLLDVLNFKHVVLTRSAADSITRLVLGDVADRGPEGMDTGSPEVTGEPDTQPDDALKENPASVSANLDDRGPEGMDTGSPEVTGEPDIAVDDVAMEKSASEPPDVALADAAADVATPESEKR